MQYTAISFGLFLLNFTLKCAFSEPASVLRNSCVNHVLFSKRFLVRTIHKKLDYSLVFYYWAQNGALCPKWRFVTNVAHCDKYGACEFDVLVYITLPSLVQIGLHLPKLWLFEVFEGSWHVPRATWRHLMNTC